MRPAAALALALFACASDGGGGGGGDDDDAVDAVASVDAHLGGEATEVACDLEYTRLVDYGNGNSYSTTFWYADVPAPDGLRGVQTMRCARETFGATATTCPDGATCTGTYVAPAADCEIGGNAELVGDRVRLWCGSRSVDVNPTRNPVTITDGWRYTTAAFRFD
jgi:hypothetical protein